MNISSSPKDLVRSTKVWFEDGTIVIQAETTLFRVYKGILQRDSTVFNDLFSLPQPASQPNYEGVPLVELKDSAKDMELFLDVLHQWRQSNVILRFKQWLTVAKLAAKYCVDDLQNWAVRPLKALYSPASLADWMSNEIQFRGDWNTTENAFVSNYLYRWQLDQSDHVAVVNSARRLGIPEVLPAAFYAAATSLSVREIINGGAVSTAFERWADDDTVWEAPAPEVYAFDDPEDAMICAEGQTRLNTLFNPLLYLARALMVVDNADSDRHCHYKVPCWHLMGAQIREPPKRYTDNQEMQRSCSEGKGPNIWELKSFCMGLETCTPCETVLKEACQSYRESVWNSLRAIFQLAPEDPQSSA